MKDRDEGDPTEADMPLVRRVGRGDAPDDELPADEDTPARRSAPPEPLPPLRREARRGSVTGDESGSRRVGRRALQPSVFAMVASALRRTGRIACERPRVGLWTLLALTSALIAAGVAGIAADNIDRWAARPGGGASMVVYLGENVDEAHATTLIDQLRTLPGVESAELVSPAESAHRLQQSLGGDASLLDGVELGSLPASVEVTLAPGVRDVVAISPTVRALRGAPGVEDVIVEDGGDDRISDALHALRFGAWGAAALFAGLALIIVLAAIRVRLDRSRDQLVVAHLLGAGSSFLVFPTALAGALQGAVAALLATGAVSFAIAKYGEAIAGALAPSLGAVELAPPTVMMIAVFIGAGATLGFVGGALAGTSRASR